jgi:competence protein ComEA
MKRFTASLALCAFVVALAAPLALAQGAAAQAPKTTTTTTTTKTTTKPAMHHKMAKPAAMAKLDVNTCTKEELAALPGVGDVTADKIIAGRPYKTKADLIKNKIVTKAQYSKLSAHVIAKQAAVAK